MMGKTEQIVRVILTYKIIEGVNFRTICISFNIKSLTLSRYRDTMLTKEAI